MKQITLRSQPAISFDLEGPTAMILQTQKPSGEIPWSAGDKTDPWDMVESAMGLGVVGHLEEARAAFAWLLRNQEADGSWFSAYRNGQAEDRTRDANMSSYIAVGVYHHYLLTSDKTFLKSMWPVVARAIDFALSLQAPGGEIYWAISPEGWIDHMALLTGSSSVYMSIKCALAIAGVLHEDRPDWQAGGRRLGEALRYRRHLFNMSKSRYSMDWFYPILVGVLTGSEAMRRINKSWDKFIVKGQGVRCVSDQPWVTIAETAELVLTLAAAGNLNLACLVFSWLNDKRFDDGSFWAGFTYPDMVIWPEEKIAWTNAGVILAADALENFSPGGRIFNHRYWQSPEFSPFPG